VDGMGNAYSMHGAKRRMHIGFCLESQKKRDQFEDPHVVGRIILK
jgi:hypothetical protein